MALSTASTGSGRGSSKPAPVRPSMGIAAAAGGVAFLVLAVIQAASPTFDEFLTSPLDWINEITFALALALTIPGLLALRRVQGAPRRATEAVVVGQLLVFIGLVAGWPAGRSPGWFFLVGVPGNLIAWIGMILLGVHTWRAKVFPKWVAVGFILAVPIGIGVAEFGGSVVPGALWLYLGVRLARSGAYEQFYGRTEGVPR